MLGATVITVAFYNPASDHETAGPIFANVEAAATWVYEKGKALVTLYPELGVIVDTERLFISDMKQLLRENDHAEMLTDRHVVVASLIKQPLLSSWPDTERREPAAQKSEPESIDPWFTQEQVYKIAVKRTDDWLNQHGYVDVEPEVPSPCLGSVTPLVSDFSR